MWPSESKAGLEWETELVVLGEAELSSAPDGYSQLSAGAPPPLGTIAPLREHSIKTEEKVHNGQSTHEQ